MGIRAMKLASKLTERSEPQENAWASGDGGKESLQLACENIRFSSGEEKWLFSQATAFVVLKSFPHKEISDFISKRMRGRLTDLLKKKEKHCSDEKTFFLTKWKVTNAIFDDAVA